MAKKKTMSEFEVGQTVQVKRGRGGVVTGIVKRPVQERTKIIREVLVQFDDETAAFCNVEHLSAE